ncbi:hypothetical protein VNI00_012677 [Paramarasmius palmivorus]|uniref:Uncharacterized protein n=1 Tax=Paramarasmius palmivorus TaxID=297713 RepID=A0AAW0C480_9AGAR
MSTNAGSARRKVDKEMLFGLTREKKITAKARNHSIEEVKTLRIPDTLIVGTHTHL